MAQHYTKKHMKLQEAGGERAASAQGTTTTSCPLPTVSPKNINVNIHV